MRKSISEIIEDCGKSKKKDDKVAVLRANDSAVLRAILKYAYDPQIEWLLPTGKPPYKPSQAFDGQGMLFTETRRLYLFVRGGNDRLTPLRREALFIGLLEALDPKDAELVCAVKDRKLPHGVTEAVVRAAFPGLLNERTA